MSEKQAFVIMTVENYHETGYIQGKKLPGTQKRMQIFKKQLI